MLRPEVSRQIHADSGALSGSRVRLPLVVRTSADLQVLRANARAVRRLPPDGISVAVEGLDDVQALKFRARIGEYVRACGCAEGALVTLATLVISAIALTMRILEFGLQWSDLGFLVVSVLLALTVGGIGKWLGLAMARRRFERSCTHAIRIIDRD